MNADQILTRLHRGIIVCIIIFYTATLCSYSSARAQIKMGSGVCCSLDTGLPLGQMRSRVEKKRKNRAVEKMKRTFKVYYWFWLLATLRTESKGRNVLVRKDTDSYQRFVLSLCGSLLSKVKKGIKVYWQSIECCTSGLEGPKPTPRVSSVVIEHSNCTTPVLRGCPGEQSAEIRRTSAFSLSLKTRTSTLKCRTESCKQGKEKIDGKKPTQSMSEGL